MKLKWFDKNINSFRQDRLQLIQTHIQYRYLIHELLKIKIKKHSSKPTKRKKLRISVKTKN